MRRLAICAFTALVLFGCTGTPVEPYAYVPPNFFAATDGNVTVIIAKAESGSAGVRILPATEASIHLLGPVPITGGKVLVRRRKPEKVALSLEIGDPLPEWCRHLFSSTEASALGVTFGAPE